MKQLRPALTLVLAALLLASGLPPRAIAQSAPVDLRILAINDLHGYLRPPPGGIRIANPEDKSKKIMASAGGVETMATLVNQLRAREATKGGQPVRVSSQALRRSTSADWRKKR